MAEQLSDSLRATYLETPVLQASALMDVERLHTNILINFLTNPIAKAHLSDSSNPSMVAYMSPRPITYVFVSLSISTIIPYQDTSVNTTH